MLELRGELASRDGQLTMARGEVAHLRAQVIDLQTEIDSSAAQLAGAWRE